MIFCCSTGRESRLCAAERQQDRVEKRKLYQHMGTEAKYRTKSILRSMPPLDLPVLLVLLRCAGQRQQWMPCSTGMSLASSAGSATALSWLVFVFGGRSRVGSEEGRWDWSPGLAMHGQTRFWSETDKSNTRDGTATTDCSWMTKLLSWKMYVLIVQMPPRGSNVIRVALEHPKLLH